MSICEDCIHYTEKNQYCDVLEDRRPSLLLSCDYFKSFWMDYMERKRINDKKDYKARYNFRGNGKFRGGKYRKTVMR